MISLLCFNPVLRMDKGKPTGMIKPSTIRVKKVTVYGQIWLIIAKDLQGNTINRTTQGVEPAFQFISFHAFNGNVRTKKESQGNNKGTRAIF